MTSPSITFNRKLFNPNFWHFHEAANNKQWRIVVFYGGSSSAKTFSLVQGIIKLALEEGEDTLVIRKVGNTLAKSIFKDFDTIIRDWGLLDFFKITPSKLSITCTFNNAKIDFTGLDDPEKIKGISQYKRVLMEELSEFEKRDFDQIRKRLRGKEGQQIFCLFNPVDETHWIKKDFFDKEDKTHLPTFINDGRPKEFTQVAEKWCNAEQDVLMPNGETKRIPANILVIRSTYLSNFWVCGSPDEKYGFVDVQTIADFERDKKYDYNFYKIYALGLWGKLNTGGEAYKKFVPQDHVKRTKYNEHLPLHLSFDENVNPYITLTVWQVDLTGEYKDLIQVDEFCLESPKNRIKDLCIAFADKYKYHKEGIFIYGDATSQKEDTKLEKGENFFTLAMGYLSKFHPSKRVPASNPSVSMRINFINEIFANNEGNIRVTIGENCSNTIEDLSYCKEDENGGKAKDKVKDKIRNITYEKYGHTSDTMDYFITYVCNKEYLTYQQGGKKRTNSFRAGGVTGRNRM